MPDKKIHEGIELWRVLACLGVIVTHLKPGAGIFPLFSEIIVRSADFAVPFFFCASGYFFSKSLKKNEKKSALAVKYLKRLAPPFLFWYLVFFIFPDMAATSANGLHSAPNYSQLIAGRIQFLIGHPWTAISEGPGYHLWYLVGLAIAFLVVGFVFKTFSIKIRQLSIVLLGIVIYVFVLCSTPFGLSHLHLRPFVGIFFISAGCLIEQQKISMRMDVAAGFFLISLVLHILESFLWQKINPGFDKTFNISALFVGVSVLLLALSTPTVKPFFSRLWTLGSLSFSVYLVHPLFIYSYNMFTMRIDGIQKIVLGIFAPFLVSGLSFALAYILNKTPLFAFSVGKNGSKKFGGKVRNY